MQETRELQPVEIDEFDLPTKPHVPEKNMNSCVLFGKPKCGKTTILSQLPNCLIVDTERGSNKVPAMSIQVPDDRGPVGKIQWLERLADKLMSEGKPYDYVAIDTLSEVNDWAEWSGTWKYMNSIMGKSFNRVDGKKGGELLEPDHPDYQSVHNLPDGHGYKWSRDEVMKIVNKFMPVARKCVFFICHIEDKFLSQKEATELVAPKQLALTGKLRDILPRKVDAIGYVYNKDGKIHVNFTGTEEKIGGNRAQHLLGYNGVFDWNKIFIK